MSLPNDYEPKAFRVVDAFTAHSDYLILQQDSRDLFRIIFKDYYVVVTRATLELIGSEIAKHMNVGVRKRRVKAVKVTYLPLMESKQVDIVDDDIVAARDDAIKQLMLPDGQISMSDLSTEHIWSDYE